ncbi:TPA: hypothetical protein ACH3X3_001763 [Trebouxia sp. C0006]
MPAGLQSVDSSFKQLQKEYIGYARRKQALILEVAGQEACLARLKQAIRQERQAIESERRQLEEEREAFEVFRGQSVADLNCQIDQLQLKREKLELYKQATCVLQENALAHTCCAEEDCQHVTNSAKLTAQREAIQFEQAELIIDLQHRLQHLADVNARDDDHR